MGIKAVGIDSNCFDGNNQRRAEMAKIRMISLVALTLSGGLIPWAGAQQIPSLQEPPLLSGSPRQAPLPDGRIQLHTGPEAPLAMDSGPGWTPPSGIQVREDRGIRYVSGGVGLNGRDQLNALSHQFNLRLLFAMQGSGNYLADVRVNIIDARGETVLSAKSDGPWFFAQLPPGAYTVDVDAMGRTQGQTVRISDARQSRLNFFWR
jgi:hypothetical protein